MAVVKILECGKVTVPRKIREREHNENKAS